MSINASFRIIATHGNDSIDKTVYCSGDTKVKLDIPIFGSGLQSGITLGFAPANLKGCVINTNAVSGINTVVAYGLSGAVTLPPLVKDQPFVWISGALQGFSGNPFPVASGDITGLSIQRSSGYDTTQSGSYTLSAMFIMNG